MTWVRSGYCCRCGDCCVGDPFEGDLDAPHRSELMKRIPRVAGYCPLYEIRDEGFEYKGFCAGHIGAAPPGKEDSYYMSGCNVWPDNPSQIADKPRCTYKFEWRDD